MARHTPHGVRCVRARALSNLALVKYFGKRDTELNLPSNGSLSLALEPLATTTAVTLLPGADADAVLLDGAPAPVSFAARASRFLDIVREMSGKDHRAVVETRNDFPTGAGLASSASGFAALALAAAGAFDLALEGPALSALARRGSGSAARSIPGGIAVWRAGKRPDGTDSFAEQIAGPEALDLRVVVAVADPREKAVGSTEAMERTRETSPYFSAWTAAAEADLAAAVDAVARRDLERLGEITEANALAMHAAALAARPGIAFWNGVTIEALHLVQRLRASGVRVYFSCDAGPQPKALCATSDVDAVIEALSSLAGIERIIPCRIGGPAEVMSTSAS